MPRYEFLLQSEVTYAVLPTRTEYGEKRALHGTGGRAFPYTAAQETVSRDRAYGRLPIGVQVS